MPIRAVLDTNVIVSGLVADKGPSRYILDAWLEDRLVLVTSLYLVEELIHVLFYPRIAKRLNIEDGELTAVIAGLLSKAHVTAGRLHLQGVTRDPKDDAVLACAIEGNAAYVVTGDEDLLTLSRYKGVQIITPRTCLELLEPCSEE